jgi:hypothetical protein
MSSATLIRHYALRGWRIVADTVADLVADQTPMISQLTQHKWRIVADDCWDRSNSNKIQKAFATWENVGMYFA